MKLGIIGSRNITNFKTFEPYITKIVQDENITTLVSGGATGVDSFAEKYSVKHQLKLILYKPNWQKHGMNAGFIRNHDIIKSSDIILAIWDGSSKGTKHSINLANNYGKPIKIITVRRKNGNKT